MGKLCIKLCLSTYLLSQCRLSLFSFIINDSILTLIRMSKCQEFKCSNAARWTEKGESFFRLLQPKNPIEWKITQQWLHNMAMRQDKEGLT